MTSRTRCVLDTNVLISAAISPRGVPLRVLRWVIEHGTLLASKATLDEFESRFIERQKFDRYLSLPGRRAFVLDIVASSTLLRVSSRLAVCSDPDDDRFVELAVNGGADCIVTGNTRDFPAEHAGIAVVTPAEFAQTWMT